MSYQLSAIAFQLLDKARQHLLHLGYSPREPLILTIRDEAKIVGEDEVILKRKALISPPWLLLIAGS